MAPKSLISSLALSIGIWISGTHASGWAQFCDDNACGVNCGESVSLDDPGCLAESGRNSILFHGTGEEFQYVNLIWSPDGACSCQNDCIANVLDGVGDGCLNLNGMSCQFVFDNFRKTMLSLSRSPIRRLVQVRWHRS